MKPTTLLPVVTLLGAFASSAVADQWKVTPIAGAPDNQIRVQVTANLSGPNPCDYYQWCNQSHLTTLTVAPCPVGETCPGDVLIRFYPTLPQAVSVTFDLRCGVQYSFGGDISSHFLLPDPFFGCGLVFPCDWVSTMVPVQFYWGATPARPLSFGRLKMLYR